MYLCSSALIFYIDWDFSLGHMSMDLSSVLAALSSRGVSSVTGTNIQVASPQGCTPGLAGPEPSGTFIHPGQHLQDSLKGSMCGITHTLGRSCMTCIPIPDLKNEIIQIQRVVKTE